MKYAALLRGINVGGNSKVSMSVLKKVFEDLGFEQVATYINSGNVVFTLGKSVSQLTKLIEGSLLREFKLPIRVVVKSQNQIEKVIDDAPKDWKSNKDIRCYVSFVLDTSWIKDIEKEVDVREGIDTLKVGPGVLYMTTKLPGLTKSAFNKFAAKKIYKEVTIRNFNTTLKILALMQKTD